MLFLNAKELYYCAECKIIHDYKVHPMKSKMKIKPMKVEAVKGYTESTRWQEKQRRDKEDNMPIAEIKRNYQRLAKPFDLNPCTVKMNRIKTRWTKEEVESMPKVNWQTYKNICKTKNDVPTVSHKPNEQKKQ